MVSRKRNALVCELISALFLSFSGFFPFLLVLSLILGFSRIQFESPLTSDLCRQKRVERILQTLFTLILVSSISLFLYNPPVEISSRYCQYRFEFGLTVLVFIGGTYCSDYFSRLFNVSERERLLINVYCNFTFVFPSICALLLDLSKLKQFYFESLKGSKSAIFEVIFSPSWHVFVQRYSVYVQFFLRIVLFFTLPVIAFPILTKWVKSDSKLKKSCAIFAHIGVVALGIKLFYLAIVGIVEHRHFRFFESIFSSFGLGCVVFAYYLSAMRQVRLLSYTNDRVGLSGEVLAHSNVE